MGFGLALRPERKIALTSKLKNMGSASMAPHAIILYVTILATLCIKGLTQSTNTVAYAVYGREMSGRRKRRWIEDIAKWTSQWQVGVGVRAL